LKNTWKLPKQKGGRFSPGRISGTGKAVWGGRLQWKGEGWTFATVERTGGGRGGGAKNKPKRLFSRRHPPRPTYFAGGNIGWGSNWRERGFRPNRGKTGKQIEFLRKRGWGALGQRGGGPLVAAGFGGGAGGRPGRGGAFFGYKKRLVTKGLGGKFGLVGEGEWGTYRNPENLLGA